MYTLLTVVYCVAIWTLVTGDYDCICNYNVEAPIHSSPAEGQPIGYMYEFDCKPLISIGKPPGWGLVAFEHKAGYLALDANIEVQMCPGSPPDGDLVYTTKPRTTTITPATTAPTALTNQKDVDTTVSSVHNTDFSILMSILTKTQSFITSSVLSNKTTRNTYITDSAYNYTTNAPIHVHTEIINNTANPLIGNTSVLTQTNKFTVSTETKTVTTSQNISLKPESMQTGVWENMTPSVTKQSNAVTTQAEHPVNQSSIPTHSTPHTPITTSFSLISKPTAYNDNKTVPEYKSTQVLSTLREVTTPKMYYPSVNTSFAEATTAVSATRRIITTPNLLNASVSESPSLIDSSRLPTPFTKPTDIITSPIISTTTDRIDLCPYKFLSEVHANIQNKVFRQYGKYCYELRLKTGTWLDASEDCSERGGMLVVITDPHVQSLVHGLVNNLQTPADIWLGLSDRDEEGVWRWVDGRQTSYTNWKPVDPVYNDIKDCAVMSHVSGSWMQAECSSYMLHTERLPWVCQYGI